MASGSESAPFDAALLSERSLAFATALLERFPWLREHARLERSGGSPLWSLVIVARAPSGDERSTVCVTDEDGAVQHVHFGRWHWHVRDGTWDWMPQAGTPFDFLTGVFTDRYVTSERLGAAKRAHDNVLDLADENALRAELAAIGPNGRVRLRSWSGALDREWTIADIERGERPR
jgi:hypothetical protein